MALVQVNSTNNGGSFLGIVKYDARAGRLFRVDKDDSGSASTDITRIFKAVFDFETVEVGWIRFSAGAAPDFQMARLEQALPARPSDDHRHGVRLHIKLAKECGGDVREFAGTSQVWLRAINDLHDQYEVGKGANPGKLPIVTMKGDPLPIEGGSGSKRSTNYQPVWQIVGWAARPADMLLEDAASSTQNGSAPQNVPHRQAMNNRPPVTGSTQVSPPPVVASVAAPVTAADDFG